MIIKYNSLEISEDYSGWIYRFHEDALTYTQDGFNSSELALEAAGKNDWVTRTTRPIRIITTEDVALQLGLDLTDGIESVILGFDLIAIPVAK